MKAKPPLKISPELDALKTKTKEAQEKMDKSAQEYFEVLAEYEKMKADLIIGKRYEQ